MNSNLPKLFTVLNNQLKALSAQMLLQFYKRMEIRLAAEFKTLQKPIPAKTELTAFIDHGIKTAKTYQLTNEDEVERYLLLMAKHGKDFNKESWAHIILNYSEFETLMDELEEASQKLEADNETKND